MSSDEERAAFVRAHTALAAAPFVPELRLLTAAAMVPLWSLTARWLGDDAAGIPFWSAPWAGGQALARYVLDHPECVRGKRVLDFGTGSGLVAIAAARAGAACVHAVDIDPLACAAAKLNAEVNGVTLQLARDDLCGALLPEIDVLLAGDVWYEPALAARIEPWLRELAGQGVRILTADPGRAYAPREALELARYEVPVRFEMESAESLTTRVLALGPTSPSRDRL